MAKKYVAIVLLIVAVIGFFWWWLGKPGKPVEKPTKQVPSPVITSTSDQTTKPEPNQPILQEYPQISLKGKTREEAVREYLRHEEKDKMYDWKIPIKFYGKVIDQHDQPVAGATVRLQWVNRQGAGGVGESNTTTDDKGQFSLEGVKGKCLLVWISREGYYDVSRKDNQTNFEFASPGQNDFYEPDPDNPVIFHMRKKAAAEALIKKSIELTPPKDGSAVTVDLLTGNQSPNGQLEVKTWKPQISAEQTRTGKVFPYDWRITLKIADGGFLEHHDVFPFEAPETGYNPLIDLSLHATNGSSKEVTAQQDCYFCFGQPRKYGRLHFNTDGDRPYVFIDYYLNPSGSRNLEYDPGKQAPAQ